MRPSLRRRLMVILSLAIVGVWLAAVVNTYVDTRKEVDLLLDAQLEQAAHVIMSMSQHELIEQMEYTRRGISFPEHEQPLLQKYTQNVAYQVWINKKLVIQSRGAPEQALANRMGLFLSRVINGKEWRVFALAHNTVDITVHVGEQVVVRNQVSRLITDNLMFYIALGIPILGFVIWLGVGQALIPLIAVKQTVESLGLDNLRKIDSHSVPVEVLPLVEALNDLFERLARAMDHMKNFTADAAHELRTPLAALKTHAQLALKAKKANDEATVNKQIEEIIESVDRASYLIDQLLTMARIDYEEYHIGDESVDLTHIAREVIANTANQMDIKHIELSLETEQSMWVVGKAPMLEIMLQNLLHNAIKYTPPRGKITVDLYTENGHICLSIADSGPGINQQKRDRLLQRFYRDSDSNIPGIGLGLSIVKRIVDIHQGQIQLGVSDLGGLLVELRLTSRVTKQVA